MNKSDEESSILTSKNGSGIQKVMIYVFSNQYDLKSIKKINYIKTVI